MSDATPNLTYTRQLAFLNRQKAQAVAAISPTETVVVAVPKLKNGKPVIDPETGVPEIKDTRVLKRDYIAKEHDDRIAKFKAERGLK
jgi:hypothetical protein